MGKLYNLLFLFLLQSSFANAQNASKYFFTSKSNVNLEKMDTFQNVMYSGIDEGYRTLPLPFTFSFAGQPFNDITITDNGIVGLGNSPVQFGSANSSIFENETTLASDVFPILMPWTDDLATANNGGISYKTAGTPGKRKFIIEWKVSNLSSISNPFDKTIQLWLYEGTNNIQFVYGPGVSSDFNNTLIGIAASSADYALVSTNTETSQLNTSLVNVTRNWPGVGISYIFSPSPYAEVTLNPISVAENAIVSNVTCNNTNNGSITLGTISGGDGNYSIQWTGAGGYTASGGSITNLQEGEYTYSVTDASHTSVATSRISILKGSGISTSDIKSFPMYAVAGQQANTIYLGYGLQSIVLSAGAVSGGSGSYTYEWTPSATSDVTNKSTYIAQPTKTTNYTLTVKDANNCATTKNVLINVIDVRCDKDKVQVCEPLGKSGKTASKCVKSSQVDQLLAKGATLGSCANTYSYAQAATVSLAAPFLLNNVKGNVYPNPSAGIFNITVNEPLASNITITVVDINGKVLAQKLVQSNGVLQNIPFNLSGYSPGIYLCKIVCETGSKTEKIVIRN